MTEHGKPKKKSLTGLLPAAASDFLSIFGIPTSTILTIHQDYVLDRRKAAQKELINSISSGNIDLLNKSDQRKLIPISLRFFKAAHDGQSDIILRILSLYINSQIDKNDINIQKYALFERSLVDLDEIHIFIIGEYAKAYKHWIYDKDQKHVNLSNQEILNIEKRIGRDRFSMNKVEVALSELAGRGWLISFSEGRLGGGPPQYWPSQRICEICDLVEKLDLVSP